MPPDLAILLAGAFGAALAVGAAGFADALVATAVWLHVLSPQETVPLVVGSGLAVHGASVLRLRVYLKPARIAPFVLAGLVGVPAGVALLHRVEPAPYKTTIGALLLAYCVVAVVKAPGPLTARAGRAGDAAVGLVGGVLGGFAGLSGVLPTIWAGLRGWDRHAQRAVYQPYILAMHAAALASLAVAGLVDAAFALRLLWCLPALALGVLAGQALYRRIDERSFRRLVLALLAGSGISLLAA